jgi:hypothetical protein
VSYSRMLSALSTAMVLVGCVAGSFALPAVTRAQSIVGGDDDVFTSEWVICSETIKCNNTQRPQCGAMPGGSCSKTRPNCTGASGDRRCYEWTAQSGSPADPDPDGEIDNACYTSNLSCQTPRNRKCAREDGTAPQNPPDEDN